MKSDYWHRVERQTLGGHFDCYDDGPEPPRDDPAWLGCDSQRTAESGMVIVWLLVGAVLGALACWWMP